METVYVCINLCVCIYPKTYHTVFSPLLINLGLPLFYPDQELRLATSLEMEVWQIPLFKQLM